jgi:hypothetical protein
MRFSAVCGFFDGCRIAHNKAAFFRAGDCGIKPIAIQHKEMGFVANY